MTTKRPSISVLSDIIQKYVGSDFDTIKEFSDNLAALAGESGLNAAVDYTEQGFPQTTLGELLKALLEDVSANTSNLNSLTDTNAGVASNTASIADILLQLEDLILGKSYKGGYDAATNIPNLESPGFNTVNQGDIFDVTVAGSFDPVGGGSVSLVIGDTLRAKISEPSSLSDWVVIPLSLAGASIKALYEGEANTNEFNDTEKTNLTTLTDGSNADSLHIHAAKNLQDAYTAGSQISVDDATGSVVVNSFGSTEAPLVLTPVTPFPTTNLQTGALAVDTDGSLFSYDGTRGKFLSVTETVFHFAKQGDARGIYLDLQSLIETNVGYVMPKAGTIVSIRARGRKNLSKSMDLQRNGISQLAFNLSSGEYIDTTLNIDFSTNNEIQLWVPLTGSVVENALVSIYVKWSK